MILGPYSSVQHHKLFPATKNFKGPENLFSLSFYEQLDKQLFSLVLDKVK